MELVEAVKHAQRTAKYYTRQRLREHDEFFKDEMTTEAIFIVTQLIMAGTDESGKTSLEQIKERFPTEEERFRFYRMAVGYGLKAYCAYRAMSTLGFLKKKGIEARHVKLEDDYVPREDHSAMMQLMLDEAAVTPMEKDVLKFYLMANDLEIISEKVGLSPKRVRKVLKRIKRRLRTTDTNPAGN